MQQDNPDPPRIDSPIHQLRQLDEAISDTGTGMLMCFGIKQFCQSVANRTPSELEAWVRELLQQPEKIMGARVENGLPILPVIAFVEDEVAAELNELVADPKQETVEE